MNAQNQILLLHFFNIQDLQLQILFLKENFPTRKKFWLTS